MSPDSMTDDVVTEAIGGELRRFGVLSSDGERVDITGVIFPSEKVAFESSTGALGVYDHLDELIGRVDPDRLVFE